MVWGQTLSIVILSENRIARFFPVHFVFNFFGKQNTVLIVALLWYPELHVCLSCGQTLS